MIVEGSGAPVILPWPDAPHEQLVAFVQAELSEIRPGGAAYQALEQAMTAITPAIYEPFVAPHIYPGNRAPLRWWVARDLQWYHSQVRGPVGSGGQYASRQGGPGALNGYATATYGIAVYVHEFGHHIDSTYKGLWPGYAGTDRRRLVLAEFAPLWRSSLPTIPDGLYGKTNEAEWFAELFTCQIVPGVSRYSPTLFVQLCGNRRELADQVRALFVSLLPMPAFTY